MTQDAPPAPEDSPPVDRPPRRRRRIRPTRILGGVVVGAAILLVLGVVLTRTPLCKVWLLPTIGSAMGVRVQASTARILPGGTVVLEDAAFLLPGVEGPAARFMTVERLEVDPDFSRSGVPISRMRLDGVVLRVSQATDADRVNLQAWELPSGGRAPGPRSRRAPPPRIDLRSATIELGEHEGEQYRVLKRINVRGAVVPRDDAGEQVWAIDLHEADPLDPTRSLEGGIAVAGRVDEAGLTLSMTRISLEDWPAGAVPSRYRDVFVLLGLEGQITRTYLDLPWEGDVEAGIVLSDVSMTLPFEARHAGRPRADETDADAPVAVEPMRLTRSGGTIRFVGAGVRAELTGWVEDLPYQVTLEYLGLEADSPFRCQMSTVGYQLSADPRLVPFLPREVMDRLADFRGPTGVVDADVVIERGPPTPQGEAPTTFSGAIRVRDGRAAFHVFPYPFEQMQAEVSFDEHAVRLDRITGVSTSGARLVASGIVTPLGEEAEVTIRVATTGVPVDELLLGSMGEDRRELLDAIFSRTRMRELEDAGLLNSADKREEMLAQRDALVRRVAELARATGEQARRDARQAQRQLTLLERTLQRPGFALGGVADVNVVVHRPRGLDTQWESLVEVALPRAGVLPAHFPLPIEAADVKFIIRDRALTLERGRFRPISGGSAALAVQALMPGEDPSTEPFVPDVRIEASGVPLDEYLVHALTRAGEPPGEPVQGQPAAAASWGRGLVEAETGGTVDARVHVLRRESGELGFDATATLAHTRAATPTKPGLAARVLLSVAGGTLVASEREVSLSLEAQAQTLGEAADDTVRPAGRFWIEARIGLAEVQGRPPGAFRVSVTGQDVVSQAPVERLAGLITSDVEGVLAALRTRYQPSGLVSGSILAEGVLGEPEPAVGVSIRALDDAAINLRAGRATIDDASGTLDITLPAPGRPGLLRAAAFSGRIGLDGAPDMLLEIDGEAELLATTAQPDAPAGESSDDAGDAIPTGRLDLRLAMRDARFESALTRAAIAAFAPARGEQVLSLDPAGAFDAALAIRRPSATDAAWFEGQIIPRSLGVTLDGRRASFESVGGEVHFDGQGGQWTDLRASSADVSVAGLAAWTRSPDGQIVLDASLSADAPRLSDAVRALLPAGLRAGLEQVALQVEGPLSLSGAVLHATWREQGQESVRATGLVHAAGVAADVGLPLAQGQGVLQFEVQAEPGQPPRYVLGIAADSVRAAGMRLTDVRARVQSGEREGEILVPLLQGEAYAGRIAGTGRMTRTRRDGAALQYDLTLQASGVRFASLLEDRQREAGRADAPDPQDAPPADASRGLLAAEVTLGGIVGDDGSRRGRGSIQLGGGTVVSLPLLLPIIEVTNLRLPASTPLDVAFAEFYVLGDRVTFEDLSAFTRTVEIWGYGTLDWTSQKLDMRFNTRSTAPIPVVSELLEGVRNEIVSTRVRGTLEEPDVGTIQFAGTRQVIDTLLGDGPNEQQRRLAEIGERARLNRSRALRAGERLRWLVASQMEGQTPAQEP